VTMLRRFGFGVSNPARELVVIGAMVEVREHGFDVPRQQALDEFGVVGLRVELAPGSRQVGETRGGALSDRLRAIMQPRCSPSEEQIERVLRSHLEIGAQRQTREREKLLLHPLEMLCAVPGRLVRQLFIHRQTMMRRSEPQGLDEETHGENDEAAPYLLPPQPPPLF